MFERYTEKARRVIFFARYETSQFGQQYIESEHLLLGLLREDKALVARLLKQTAGGAGVVDWVEAIRKQVESVSPPREKISTSVDLPLSDESKRILFCAAEEAEALSQKHIGTEHLLLGMLREHGCLAEQLLRERGVTREQAREVALSSSPPQEPMVIGRTARPGSGMIDSVEIHGARWNATYVLPLVTDMRKFHWERRDWKPRDVLVERQTGSLRFCDGDCYDSSAFELKPGGWERERCRICRWELFAGPDKTHALGFTNGRDWLCTECHDKFIAGYKPEPEDYT